MHKQDPTLTKYDKVKKIINIDGPTIYYKFNPETLSWESRCCQKRCHTQTTLGFF